MPLTGRFQVITAAAAAPGTSFADRLWIWLHVVFVIFTIGPVTIAILSTPRYIKKRNVAVLRYMLRTTRIFGTASLGVLAFGIVAAQALDELSDSWITTTMTLFVVSLVLLVLILRDQRRAIVALETASEREALTTANATGAAGGASAAAAQDGHDDAPGAQAIPAAPAAHAAPVERGRIASLGGIVTLIWLVILVLMIWNS